MEIIYGSERFIKSFHEALDAVAKEQIYIEKIEAKSFNEVAAFQGELIDGLQMELFF
jgi:hypothetical protein